jgi:hypothetical protein
VAVVVVQTSTNGSTFTSAVTAGNTVYIIPVLYTTAGNPITSSNPTLGGSSVSGTSKLQEVSSPLAGSNGAYHAIWQLPNIPGGATTYGISHTENQAGLMAVEVSGLGPAPVLDQNSTGSGNSTAVDSGHNPPTTFAPELVLGAAAVFGASSGGPSGGGWTNFFANTNSWAGYQIAAASGGTYDYSMTGNAPGPWSAGVVTVRGPVAPAPVTVAAAAGGDENRQTALKKLDILLLYLYVCVHGPSTSARPTWVCGMSLRRQQPPGAASQYQAC